MSEQNKITIKVVRKGVLASLPKQMHKLRVVKYKHKKEKAADIFSHIVEKDLYYCVGTIWHQCIPYEGNEHLLGTTNKPE